MKKKADIKCEELMMISEKRSKNRLSKIRVVKWIIDGKEFSPKIEKRDFFAFEGQDEPKMGKCVGFSKEDMQEIIQHWDEILMWF
jgi:hypothetical protein